MHEDIVSKNKAGQLHGYCKIRYSDKFAFKGVWVNGCRHGCHEDYNIADVSFREYGSGYFLEGNKVSDDNIKGYCYIWERKEII